MNPACLIPEPSFASENEGSAMFMEEGDQTEKHPRGKAQMALWLRMQNRKKPRFLYYFFQLPVSASKEESRCGAVVSCLGLLKQRRNWPGISKAGAGMQPTADFRQIIFTSISLFPPLENRGNKICSPLTSHECFPDKRWSYAEHHVLITVVVVGRPWVND